MRSTENKTTSSDIHINGRKRASPLSPRDQQQPNLISRQVRRNTRLEHNQVQNNGGAEQLIMLAVTPRRARQIIE